MLTSTEEADRISLKNNLRISDLLRPFMALENASVPLRTASSTTTIKNLKFRIVEQGSLNQSSISSVESQLNNAVASDAPTLNDTLQIYKETLNTLDEARASLSSSKLLKGGCTPKPWYISYRNILVDGMRYYEHELFDAPVAIVYVVSSTNSDPLSCFDELQANYHLPDVFSRGLYSSKIPHYYILLHDVREASTVDTEKLMKKIQSAYPSSICKMLPINSLPSASSISRSNLWIHSSKPPSLLDPPTNRVTILHPPTTSSSDGSDGGTPIFGGYLADDDIRKISTGCQEIIIKGIIPSLEHTINEINNSVTEKRKGLRNAFKSWWRKPKEKETVKAGDAIYHTSTIESQIRYLADLCFMLKDYEQAQGLYRLVKDDFKADKAWWHYAACNEMIALCLFMIDGTFRSDIDSFLEVAYSSYKQSAEEEIRGSDKANLAKRFATRSVFLSVDVMLSSSNYNLQLRPAAALLLKVSSEENALCAALLLEQAAMCFLNISPTPLFRKYGFHLIMAGHLFHKSGHKYNAVRCYAAAAGVYRGMRWFHIDDHINFTLGRQLYALSDAENAIRFFLQLIGTGRQPAERQNTFLREFLTIVKSWGSADGMPSRTLKEIKDLALPTVLDATVQLNDLENAASVVEHGHQLIQSSEGTSTTGSQVWDSLSLDMTNKINAHQKGKWHVLWEAPLKAKKNLGKMPIVTRVAGEPILLDVVIENPLAIKVELQEMQLFGELNAVVVDPVSKAESASDNRAALLREVEKRSVTKDFPADTTDVHSSSVISPTKITDSMRRLSSSTLPVSPSPPVKASGVSTPALPTVSEEEGTVVDHSAVVPTSDFLVVPIQLVLAPTSKKLVRLSVTPKCDGALNIHGLCWKLFGEVWGRHKFQLLGEPLNDTREHRANGVRSIDTRLQAKVVSNMPWLGVTFKNLPLSILEGQVVKASLILTNSGVSPLSNLYVNVSSPALIFGKSSHLNDDAFAAAASSPGDDVLCPSLGANGTLFHLLSSSETLEPGTSLTLPVWVKGIGEETQTINLIFRYDTGNKALSVRDIKHTLHLAITPSVSVETFPLPSNHEEGTFLLGVAITNVREDNQGIDFQQCSTLSNIWRGSIVSEPLRSYYIPPGETITVYLKLTDMKNSTGTCKEGTQPLEAFDMPLDPSSTATRAAVSSLLSPVLMYYMRMENAVELIDAYTRKEALARESCEKENISYRPEPLPEDVPCHSHVRSLVFHKQELHLMLLWGLRSDEAGGNERVNGQTNLINVRLRKRVIQQNLGTSDDRRLRAGSVIDNSSKPLPSLLLTLQHPHSATISGGEGATVCIPVQVTIFNGSPPGSKPLSFVFQTLKNEEDCNGRTKKLYPRFSWNGMTKKTFLLVEAGGKVHVTLKAIFYDKGVYDLNRFKCIILPPPNTISIPSVVQTFSNQSIIHISTMAGDGASGGSTVSPITEDVTSIRMNEVVTSTEEELPEEMDMRSDDILNEEEKTILQEQEILTLSEFKEEIVDTTLEVDQVEIALERAGSPLAPLEMSAPSAIDTTVAEAVSPTSAPVEPYSVPITSPVTHIGTFNFDEAVAISESVAEEDVEEGTDL